MFTHGTLPTKRSNSRSPGFTRTTCICNWRSRGDIRALAVVKSEDGKGYDDLTIAIPGSDPTDLLNVLGAIGGVEVLSIIPL